LTADFTAVKGEFAGHPHIRVEPVGAQPPEIYRVTYKVVGLRLEGDQPVPADEHVAEIRLPLGYPRESPYVVPRTPVFHPNIAAHYCIGDYWSAGQPLADIIRKIGDMIQYRTYNVKSPLDAVAARWTAENETLFPIGDIELGTPEIDVEIKPKSESPTPPAPARAPAPEPTVEKPAPRKRLEVEV
jgi:ubiquitin-protein ligase